jgi:hypothetical protein
VFIGVHLWPILFVACVGCAGYQIGSQTMYPANIRTVYVPIFRSDSFRRQLGERLTEAVVKRIESTTPLKVVGRPDADSVLEGRIVSERKSVVTESAYDEGRDVETEWRVEVSWIDAQGRTIGANMLQPVPPALLNVTGSGHFMPEAGQSLATAQRDTIDQLAKQIVEQMEVPW